MVSTFQKHRLERRAKTSLTKKTSSALAKCVAYRNCVRRSDEQQYGGDLEAVAVRTTRNVYKSVKFAEIYNPY